ncbi:MAG: hypothetical protein RJQ10_10545, partial [Haliea sp.]|uniref:hypothetical protein n=1 Tax=Haliea sp. TaxID=1932666 RepID=UPI0032EC02F9
ENLAGLDIPSFMAPLQFVTLGNCSFQWCSTWKSNFLGGTWHGLLDRLLPVFFETGHSLLFLDT